MPDTEDQSMMGRFVRVERQVRVQIEEQYNGLIIMAYGLWCALVVFLLYLHLFIVQGHENL